MKPLYHLPSLIFIIFASTVCLGLSTLPQDEESKSIKTSSSKKYKVHFLSFKRGHNISSSYFTFKDQEKFEVEIPGETFLKTKGDYTKNNLQFKANFKGTIIKQNKHYCYTFNITGISLLDSYIAGMLILNESIKETHQDQEVTFLFIGMPEEKNISDNKKEACFLFNFPLCNR